jgi:hypothetical protein
MSLGRAWLQGVAAGANDDGNRRNGSGEPGA